MKFTSYAKIASGLLLAFALTGNLAKASPSSISGQITFNGVAVVNTNNLATATSFTSISGVSVVQTDTGNYTGLAGDAATFTPFAFSAASVAPLWTFTAGGITYSFAATSVAIQSQTSGFLNLYGSGVASETGYADTIGSWTITDTGNGPSFSFGAGTTVPDSGATALLIALGFGAAGLGLLAQKRKLVGV